MQDEAIDLAPYRRRLLAIAEALRLQLQIKEFDLIQQAIIAATTWESLPRLLKTIAHLEVADGAQLACAFAQLFHGGLSAGIRLPEPIMLGNLFEISVKWRIQRANTQLHKFDSPLPNGRNVDVRVVNGDLPLNIECTINDMSDDDKKFWDQLITRTELAQAEADTQGKDFQPIVEVRSRNIYGDARRIFLKVFDKLTVDGNPAKSQLSLTEPNLLCVGFPSTLYQNSRSLNVDWALEELFRQRSVDEPLGATSAEKFDVSLPSFLVHRLNDMHARGCLKEKPTSQLVRQNLAQTRLIGAIAFFNGLTLTRTVRNSQAFPANAITVEQEQFFNEAMQNPPNWCPSGPLLE
jgi:hypothetical protein